MQIESPKAEPPKRKRRWFQFSLRTLMIFTVICAIGAGRLGQRIEQKRKERAAVEAIAKLGGNVEYDYETVKGATPPGLKFLRDWLGENFFTEVATVQIHAHDTGLDWLIPIKEVTLKDSHFTETGLARLKSLPGLRSLSLSGNRITDKELARLNGLAKLKSLSLAGADIGDAGLAKLKSLSELESLNVRKTRVTDAGVKDLQKALPNCKIKH
jgi:Leucine rich repeat